MAVYGYVRISDGKQGFSGQIGSLVEGGVERGSVLTDIASGSVPPEGREGFSRLLEALNEGDEVVVYSMDRFSRDESAAASCIAAIEARGATVRTLE